MRRRRKPLQVNTFPFLAVLLCAMGALILVLLVMDRRSRLAAQNRAQEEARRQLDDQVQALAERRNEYETKKRSLRQVWEKKRDALLARVGAEESALQAELRLIQARLAKAAQRVDDEEGTVAKLRQKLQGEQTRLQQQQQALAAARKDANNVTARMQATDQTKTKLAGELIRLEKSLKDLQEARQRDAQTYSVIPYFGKRGENRQPMYIECSNVGLIFHPDKLQLDGSIDPARIRGELRQRAVVQIARMKAAGAQDTRPYVMLLVRPDGVNRYYQMQAVLRSEGMEYGYEFVDADWILHVPTEGPPPPPQLASLQAPGTGGAPWTAQPGTPGASSGIVGNRPGGIITTPIGPGSSGPGNGPYGPGNGRGGSPGQAAPGGIGTTPGGRSPGAGVLGTGPFVPGSGNGVGSGFPGGFPGGGFAGTPGVGSPGGSGPGGPGTRVLGTGPYVQGAGNGVGSGFPGGYPGGGGGGTSGVGVPGGSGPGGPGARVLGTGPYVQGSGAGVGSGFPGGYPGGGVGGTPGSGSPGGSGPGVPGAGPFGPGMAGGPGGFGPSGTNGAGSPPFGAGPGGGPGGFGPSGTGNGAGVPGGGSSTGSGVAGAGTGAPWGTVPGGSGSPGGPGQAGPGGYGVPGVGNLTAGLGNPIAAAPGGVPGGMGAGTGTGGTGMGGSGAGNPSTDSRSLAALTSPPGYGGDAAGQPLLGGALGGGGMGNSSSGAAPGAAGTGSASTGGAPAGLAGPSLLNLPSYGRSGGSGGAPGGTSQEPASSGTPPPPPVDTTQPPTKTGTSGPSWAGSKSTINPGLPLSRPGGGGGARSQETASFAPEAPPVPTRKPPNLRPARLGSDGQYVIFIECWCDQVVIYPSRRRVAIDSLNHSPNFNPLLKTVEQMIARRTSMLQPGEKQPYMQVRFLIHNGGERTLHLAYPALDSVHVEKASYRLQPEDNVEQMISAY